MQQIRRTIESPYSVPYNSDSVPPSALRLTIKSASIASHRWLELDVCARQRQVPGEECLRRACELGPEWDGALDEYWVRVDGRVALAAPPGRWDSPSGETREQTAARGKRDGEGETREAASTLCGDKGKRQEGRSGCLSGNPWTEQVRAVQMELAQAEQVKQLSRFEARW